MLNVYVEGANYTCHVYSVCLLHVSDHLPPEQRSRFKTLDDNMDFLSQELRRDVITDYLRQRDLLTEDQYQHVIDMKYRHKANKYLLQLIRSESGEYLRGMKRALVETEQLSGSYRKLTQCFRWV